MSAPQRRDSCALGWEVRCPVTLGSVTSASSLEIAKFSCTICRSHVMKRVMKDIMKDIIKGSAHYGSKANQIAAVRYIMKRIMFRTVHNGRPFVHNDNIAHYEAHLALHFTSV